jgi:putative membrane-bound dehydrogenase-like protein
MTYAHRGVLLLAAIGAAVVAGGQSPVDRSLKNLRVAEGLEVTLFAAEPDLINPTSIDVDARGRVWVTEAANYRLFKNPVSRAAGDRIRVLEDTNGDGRADKATTFYQDKSLQAPLGVAVLGSRVYVCQSPDLFYLEDTDGDGVADRRTVVLTGFKGVDHDHAIHGVNFGPDGLLYMSNGDSGLDVTDRQGHRIQVGADTP